MLKLKSIAAILGVVSLCAGYADAQMQPGTAAGQHDPSMQNGQGGGGSTSQSVATHPMSKMDMQALKSCQAMSHDTMMATLRCQMLMRRYPQLVQSDGTLSAPPVTPQ